MILAICFLTAAGNALAGPGKPNFGPAIYADGVAWGTKGTTPLPPPNEHNLQSYDILYIFTNGADGQLPVSDAGPGNPLYNGGRWYTHTVTWINDPPEIFVLKSYEDIMTQYDQGYLMITPDPPGEGTNFQCPLLPVKMW
jgi:hypothetical protein